MSAPAAADSLTAPPALAPGEFRRLAAAAGLSPDRCSSLAVAVSGGADSMALAHLVAAWAGPRRGAVTALTVDHGLRRESAAEARTVAAWARGIGLRHETLAWRHGGVTRRVQATARAARYRLMGAWCRRAGVTELLLAHHLDDQAETFLMRLAAGSGVRGLGCMRVRTATEAVELVRPLLGVPKSRLHATLALRGGACVEDPSNRDLRYTRTRLRNLLRHPASRLPAPARLARAAGSFRRLDALAERATAAHLRDSVLVSPLGFMAVGLAAFAALPDLLALRWVAAAVQAVAGRSYPPRTRSLRRILDRIRGGALGRSTLGGAILTLDDGRLIVMREPRAVSGPVRLRFPTSVWDNRFRIATDVPGDDLTVGALGPHDLRSLPGPLPGPGACRAHLATLPAFRDLDGLAAVPHLDWWRDPRLRNRMQAVFAPRSGLPAGGPRPETGSGRNAGH